MRWLTESVRNKINAIFVAGLLVVFASGLYGIVTGRTGLKSVETITASAVEGGFAVARAAGGGAAQAEGWEQF